MAKIDRKKRKATRKSESPETEPVAALRQTRAALRKKERNATEAMWDALQTAYRCAHDIFDDDDALNEFIGDPFWKVCKQGRPQLDSTLEQLLRYSVRYVMGAADTEGARYNWAARCAKVLWAYSKQDISPDDVADRLKADGGVYAVYYELSKPKKAASDNDDEDDNNDDKESNDDNENGDANEIGVLNDNDDGSGNDDEEDTSASDDQDEENIRGSDADVENDSGGATAEVTSQPKRQSSTTRSGGGTSTKPTIDWKRHVAIDMLTPEELTGFLEHPKGTKAEMIVEFINDGWPKEIHCAYYNIMKR